MFLKTLKVQHYKSLDDVSVDFAAGVTIIVGPNAVGKSNFVDVLRFLRDAVVDGLEHAITKREGITRLLQSYRTKPYKIGVQCAFEATNSAQLRPVADYQLQMRAVGQSNYAIDQEKCFSYSDDLGIDHYFQHLESSRDASGFIHLVVPETTQGLTVLKTKSLGNLLSPDALALGAKHIFDGESRVFGANIATHTAGWNFCTIYPNTLKKPAIPDRDTALMESGDNWASILKSLKRSPSGRAVLERIYDAMRVVIPTFVEVTVSTVGSYLVPRFKFLANAEKENSTTSFDPVQLSDGTLRLFGILLAAYQLPSPSLLVIEEPEQTIYPGALAVLADVFKEVAQTTQVIITTHSPHLVQYFEPEQIRVATMHNGLTNIRPVHPNQIQAVHEGLLSLEEFMTGEGLRPDDTPPAAS